MESSSKFCEELPIPEENAGVKIISNKDESARETKVDIKEDKTHVEPISLSGQVNFLWLFGLF